MPPGSLFLPPSSPPPHCHKRSHLVDARACRCRAQLSRRHDGPRRPATSERKNIRCNERRDQDLCVGSLRGSRQLNVELCAEWICLDVLLIMIITVDSRHSRRPRLVVTFSSSSEMGVRSLRGLMCSWPQKSPLVGWRQHGHSELTLILNVRQAHLKTKQIEIYLLVMAVE